MYKLLTIITAMLLALNVSAQKYDALWKQVEQAREADKPVSCLQVLKKIEKKAEKEGQYGHLMAALFSELGQQQEISDDSLKAAVAKLNARDSLNFGKDQVALWIYWIAKKKYKDANSDAKLDIPSFLKQYKGFGDSKATNSLVKYLLYLQEVNAHGIGSLTSSASALKYVPLIEKEKDSKYFNNDVISVIATELEDYEPLIGWYSKHGNRPAACLAAAKYLETLREYAYDKKKYPALIAKADSLIGVFSDLKECGELAVEKYNLMEIHSEKAEDKIAWIDEALTKWPTWQNINDLKNERAQLTQPTFNAKIDAPNCLSSKEQKVYFSNLRNVSELKVTATPLNLDTKTVIEKLKSVDRVMWETPEDIKKYLQKDKAVSVTKTCEKHKEWESFKDTLSLGTLPLGMWYIETECDGNSFESTPIILNITDLKIISLVLSDKKMRYVVVNAESGQPVADAKLHLIYNNAENYEDITVDVDKNGEYILDCSNSSKQEKPFEVYASTESDRCSEPASFRDYFQKKYSNEGTNSYTDIFTDRSIYRPGQTVQVSVLASEVTNGTETKVSSGKTVAVTFKDANYKVIARDTLKTDDFGVATTEFKIPEHGLNGRYTISMPGGSKTIRVEEYVRPTFEVTIQKPEIAYRAGDTINVTGTAKTYSGVPVADSRVVYTVYRKTCWWWRSPYTQSKLANDTVYTDKQGNFTMRVPMVLPETNSPWEPRFYTNGIEAQVTDLAGESHSATLDLTVGNRETILTSDMKSKILADSACYVTFTRRNMSGTEIAGEISLAIDGNALPSTVAGEKMLLPMDLVSGKHKLVAICEKDTLEKDFITFRQSDKRPAVDTPDWWYSEGNTFSQNDDKNVAWVQFGSSKRKVHVVYSLFAEDKVIESGTMELDSAVCTKEFKYKPEYGDGICYTVAWVKDGKMYSHRQTLTRALPDKTLNLKWETFRNKLLPGQKEEWRMSITDKDGKPAKANLMTTLYDKSLDALYKHDWNLSDRRYISQPSYYWKERNYSYLHASGQKEIKYLDTRELLFSHFNVQYFERGFKDNLLYAASPRLMSVGASNSTAELREVRIRGRAMAKSSASGDKVFDSVESVGANSDMLIGSIGGLDNTDGVASEEVQVRENLSELAFFQPQIRTDNKGIASIAFTLPESVTTWKFIAVANDKDVRFGKMTDEVVAQKKLMVQPRVPRFMRAGDKVMLPTTISNLSDKNINAKVKLTILDAETEKVLTSIINKVEIKAGETSATSFPVDSKDYEDKVLICKITAEGNGFSDGEQHYLPVLSAKELVMDTHSYILEGKGEKALLIDSLMPKNAKDGKLTVEYTDSPEWLMVEALPWLTTSYNDNAISLVVAYYANNIASFIATRCNIKGGEDAKNVLNGQATAGLQSALEKNEDLKLTLLDETPWIADANNETARMQKLYNLFDKEQLAYRNTNIINKLSELQNADGSFSWWKGMRGSNYMTMAVMQALTRLSASIGLNKDASQLVQRGRSYIDKEISRQLDEIKKAKQKYKNYKPSLSGFQLDYLYMLAISGKKPTGVALTSKNYLMNYIVPETKFIDIQDKAMMAIVYNAFGQKDKAKDFLESIRQHTVYREDIGRYFDSYRASYSWRDYRIPTQVSTIEALKSVEPEDTKTITEMQRWLLQSKRTQSWDTPINAVDAIYAFFGNKPELRQGEKAEVKIDGREEPSTVASGVIDQLGYEKVSKDVTAKDKSLYVTKNTDGESWMNVYVQSYQSMAEITGQSNGITITRTYSEKDFKVGDKVTVTLTITADRDYDFVTVTDKRPACFEPVYQLSGYRNGCYQVMRDSQSQYHFDMLSKGTHTITTEYYVTQEGNFTAGSASAQCAYATEFCGHTGGAKVEVKK